MKVVTIYAFSIENFKRSKHEVDALMSMAKVKLEQLSEHGALLDRYGASVRVLGQRELIKPDVLKAVDKAVSRTAHNKKSVPQRLWLSLFILTSTGPSSTSVSPIHHDTKSRRQ